MSDALLDPDGNMIAVVSGAVRRLSLDGGDEALYTPPDTSELPEDEFGNTHLFEARSIFGAVERAASVSNGSAMRPMSDAGTGP